jgi:hypothetical protein
MHLHGELHRTNLAREARGDRASRVGSTGKSWRVANQILTLILWFAVKWTNMAYKTWSTLADSNGDGNHFGNYHSKRASRFRISIWVRSEEWGVRSEDGVRGRHFLAAIAMMIRKWMTKGYRYTWYMYVFIYLALVSVLSWHIGFTRALPFTIFSYINDCIIEKVKNKVLHIL